MTSDSANPAPTKEDTPTHVVASSASAEDEDMVDVRNIFSSDELRDIDIVVPDAERASALDAPPPPPPPPAPSQPSAATTPFSSAAASGAAAATTVPDATSAEEPAAGKAAPPTKAKKKKKKKSEAATPRAKAGESGGSGDASADEGGEEEENAKSSKKKKKEPVRRDVRMNFEWGPVIEPTKIRRDGDSAAADASGNGDKKGKEGRPDMQGHRSVKVIMNYDSGRKREVTFTVGDIVCDVWKSKIDGAPALECNLHVIDKIVRDNVSKGPMFRLHRHALLEKLENVPEQYSQRISDGERLLCPTSLWYLCKSLNFTCLHRVSAKARVTVVSDVYVRASEADNSVTLVDPTQIPDGQSYEDYLSSEHFTAPREDTMFRDELTALGITRSSPKNKLLNPPDGYTNGIKKVPKEVGGGGGTAAGAAAKSNRPKKKTRRGSDDGKDKKAKARAKESKEEEDEPKQKAVAAEDDDESDTDKESPPPPPSKKAKKGGGGGNTVEKQAKTLELDKAKMTTETLEFIHDRIEEINADSAGPGSKSSKLRISMIVNAAMNLPALAFP